MGISQIGHLASPGRTLDKSLFNQIRLIYLLHRSGILAQSRRNSRQPYGAAFEFIDNDRKYLIVDLVEPVIIDIKRFQRLTCYLQNDPPRPIKMGKITNTTQQGIPDTRRSTTAHSDLGSRIMRTRHAQLLGRPLYNMSQYGMIVIFQMTVYPESGTQRTRQ